MEIFAQNIQSCLVIKLPRFTLVFGPAVNGLADVQVDP